MYFCLLLWMAAAASLTEKQPVTVEAVANYTAKGCAACEPVWAPDGQRFAYTFENAVWIYDVGARSATRICELSELSREATALRRSEAFEWTNRNVKDEKVQWSPDGARLLISAGSDLFWYDIGGRKWQQLTATAEAERDPKLSPDGFRVSFERGNELFVLEISSREAKQLTHDASGTLWNGRLDWVYPEELQLGTAHWWSPDSKSIAYLQFDVSRQMIYPHADLLKRPAVYEPQRFPQAGSPNPDVRLGVVGIAGGRTRWMDTGDTREHLLARVSWLRNSREVVTLRLNRVQNRLDVIVADAVGGNSRLLLREEDPHWVNLSDGFRFLDESFVWSSERSGYRHLYLYSLDGKLKRQLTSGEWVVTDLAGVDEPRRVIYFVSTEESPLERHLYSIGFDGRAKRKLTALAGTHAISMAPNAAHYVDTASNLMEPVRKTVHTAAGKEVAVWHEPDRELARRYDIPPAELMEIKADDGAVLYARLTRPAVFNSSRKYPAVVIVYGGPHAQNVVRKWPGLSWEHALAHRGYVVWQMDNRGTYNRGHAWETRLYRRLGKQELEDQRAGVRHLISLGFVDPERIGIYGWSYGGFMTLYALVNAPDLFRAGIAGAPVTDWRLYDTIYTERYLGLPSDNEEGYRQSSPLQRAEQLRARLLLVHNLDDDNVLFQHTLQFMDALQRHNKPFELMIYPQKTHHVSGAAKRHMLEGMTDFLDRNLKP
jgi:dipeptidyl-peptidase-4